MFVSTIEGRSQMLVMLIEKGQEFVSTIEGRSKMLVMLI